MSFHLLCQYRCSRFRLHCILFLFLRVVIQRSIPIAPTLSFTCCETIACALPFKHETLEFWNRISLATRISEGSCQNGDERGFLKTWANCCLDTFVDVDIFKMFIFWVGTNQNKSCMRQEEFRTVICILQKGSNCKCEILLLFWSMTVKCVL